MGMGGVTGGHGKAVRVAGAVLSSDREGKTPPGHLPHRFVSGKAKGAGQAHQPKQSATLSHSGQVMSGALAGAVSLPQGTVAVATSVVVGGAPRADGAAVEGEVEAGPREYVLGLACMEWYKQTKFFSRGAKGGGGAPKEGKQGRSGRGGHGGNARVGGMGGSQEQIGSQEYIGTQEHVVGTPEEDSDDEDKPLGSRY